LRRLAETETPKFRPLPKAPLPPPGRERIFPGVTVSAIVLNLSFGRAGFKREVRGPPFRQRGFISHGPLWQRGWLAEFGGTSRRFSGPAKWD
jgi:hypothetical protein